MKLKLANLGLIFLIPFFFSCKKRENSYESLKLASKFNELEANLLDVPFPLDKSFVEFSDTKISILSDSDLNFLLDFYKSNLEILGWNPICSFKEHIFWYEKPHKYMTLIFDCDMQSKIKVSIYLTEK